MTTSALDIITSAAKKIGVVFKSEALASDEANDGLNALNSMLDVWSNDDLMTYSLTVENFTMTGAQSYTIGVGGTLNTSRPIDIASAVIRQGSIDYPMYILSPIQYQNDVALKTLSTSIPKYFTYDNGYPLGTIKMYSVPSSGGVLYLQSNKPLANLSSLSSVVDLPPGWKEALIYNLAIRLAPEYGVDIPQSVSELAATSKGAIKSSTLANNPMPLLPSSTREGNIYSGWYS